MLKRKRWTWVTFLCKQCERKEFVLKELRKIDENKRKAYKKLKIISNNVPKVKNYVNQKIKKSHEWKEEKIEESGSHRKPSVIHPSIRPFIGSLNQPVSQSLSHSDRQTAWDCCHQLSKYSLLFPDAGWCPEWTAGKQMTCDVTKSLDHLGHSCQLG